MPTSGKDEDIMRNFRPIRSATLGLLAVLAATVASQADARRNDDDRLVEAAHVLDVFATDEDHGIPVQVLEQARGILVIPNLFRGGWLSRC